LLTLLFSRNFRPWFFSHFPCWPYWVWCVRKVSFNIARSIFRSKLKTTWIHGIIF